MTYRHIPILPEDLVASRKRKGISLSQIADATKISLRYLRAIESGDFRKLPGGTYALSYVRQYAKAIGDEDHVAENYYRKVALTDEAPVAVAAATELWTCRLPAWVRSFLGLTVGRLSARHQHAGGQS